MSADTRPVLFVTNHVPPDRAGAFAALHERVPLELALFGGRSHHATAGVADPGVPHRHIAQRDVLRLAAAGSHRAVVCGTAGRVALPAAWTGARRGGVPFVLWTALWAPIRTPAHLLATPLLRRIHATADAVVTYGPHVSAHARTLGARELHVAPQAVDGAFWSVAGDVGARDEPGGPLRAVWVGRAAAGKGLEVLLSAWARMPPGARLDLVGITRAQAHKATGGTEWPAGVTAHGHVEPVEVRNFLGSADVLVIPSIATPAFREPWALVANEAMHQGTPVIATDAVGATAGGLVRDNRNGLVVPAAAGALATALTRLQDDTRLRARLGAAARRDVAPYSFDAWANGFAEGLSAATERFAHRSRGSSCR